MHLDWNSRMLLLLQVKVDGRVNPENAEDVLEHQGTRLSDHLTSKGLDEL